MDREDVAGTGVDALPQEQAGARPNWLGCQTEKLWSGRQRGPIGVGRWVHDHGHARNHSAPCGRASRRGLGRCYCGLDGRASRSATSRALRSCSSFSARFLAASSSSRRFCSSRSARAALSPSRALRSCSSRSARFLTACSSSRRFCFLAFDTPSFSLFARFVLLFLFLGAFLGGFLFRHDAFVPRLRRAAAQPPRFLVLSLFVAPCAPALLARRAPWPLALVATLLLLGAMRRRSSPPHEPCRSRSSRRSVAIGVLLHRDASALGRQHGRIRSSASAAFEWLIQPSLVLDVRGCFAHLTDGLAEPRGNFRKHVWPRKSTATKK